MLKAVLFSAFVGVAYVAVFASGQGSTLPSANCLGCICQASTGCNQTMTCVSTHTYLCGPFLISWNFWADAGKLVKDPTDDPNVKGVFEKCVNDIFCAGDTVAAYLQKYYQDCDGNGAVTCHDYARIHQLGGNGCTGAISPDNPFFNTLDTCLAIVGE